MASQWNQDKELAPQQSSQDPSNPHQVYLLSLNAHYISHFFFPFLKVLADKLWFLLLALLSSTPSQLLHIAFLHINSHLVQTIMLWDKRNCFKLKKLRLKSFEMLNNLPKFIQQVNSRYKAKFILLFIQYFVSTYVPDATLGTEERVNKQILSKFYPSLLLFNAWHKAPPV